MTRSLILHIGAHKTGSTSIQYALGTNGERLRQHAILFPTAARINRSHRRIVFGLRKRPDPVAGDVPDPEREVEAVLREIAEIGPAKVIVSCEAMFGLDRRSIRFIRDRFKAFDTQVIVYIRRQDNMLLSIYNQRIKTTRNQFHVSFKNVLGDPRRYVDDYRLYFDRWSAIFGKENIIARCYEQVGDVVTDFQGLVGIPFPLIDADAPIERNTSVSIDGIRAMRLLKPLLRDNRRRKRVLRLLRKLPLRNDVSSLMTDDDRRRILEMFKEDNEYVFRKYLNSDNLYDPALLDRGGRGSAMPYSAVIGDDGLVRPAR